MLLIEKITKHLSQLNEMFSLLDKNSQYVKAFIIILEDLHNLLNESTYKGNSTEILSNQNVNHLSEDEEAIVAENFIPTHLKFAIEKEIDQCFAACSQIYKKYTSSLLKKTFHYIKIFLFDSPESILENKNIILLQHILNVRMILKEQNFAILYEDINRVRAHQKYNQKNKKLSSMDEFIEQQNQPQQKNPFKNKSGGDIIDEKSNDNLYSFETPLPPDSNNQFQKIGQILKDGKNFSFYSTKNKSKEDEEEKKNGTDKKEKQQIQPMRYQLEPLTHASLKIQDNLQEIAICKTVNFNDDVRVEKDYTYKDIYTFKRAQYSQILENKQQDLGRISRNHASLRIKLLKNGSQTNPVYYLVNHSSNGCSVLKDGSNEWIRVKDVGQEYQLSNNDTIGILFDNTTFDLLIGYKLSFQ